MLRLGKGRADRPPPDWTREKMLALLAGAALTGLVLAAGLILAVVYAIHPAGHTAGHTAASRAEATGPAGAHAHAGGGPPAGSSPEDVLAARVMPKVPDSASHPGPVSMRDPGRPIVLPAATRVGPAGVPTGFPRTPEGAMAQMAAIDQVALQSGSLAGVRAAIAVWAAPGGPTATSWSGVKAMATFLDAAGLSGGGSDQLALVATPLMGQLKGHVGGGFVVPCVDFELDVTLAQTSRGAVADCERMVWTDGRWLIGPGAEPVSPPSVWPDTDTAISVGYRDLRRG